MEDNILFYLQKYYDKFHIIKPLIKYRNVTIISQKNVLDLYKIDLLSHRKARLALYYHLHMQPSEIDNMYYYDFEDLLFDLSELLKEKNEAEKRAYNNDQKETGANQYKQPKMPSYKMPKMPRFK